MPELDVSNKLCSAVYDTFTVTTQVVYASKFIDIYDAQSIPFTS